MTIFEILLYRWFVCFEHSKYQFISQHFNTHSFTGFDCFLSHCINWFIQVILPQFIRFVGCAQTYRDHLEKISAGVRLLYLFSSLSTPIGGSRLNNGLRLLAMYNNNKNDYINKLKRFTYFFRTFTLIVWRGRINIYGMIFWWFMNRWLICTGCW